MVGGVINDGCMIGVSDHGGWAVLVTAKGDGTLLDRRRVELVDQDLPRIPHHSEGQSMPLPEAIALVERVQASAQRHAKLVLDAVAKSVPGSILGVALRLCPPLPPTVAARLQDYRAQNLADWVMYRQALAAAAETRGWPVHWFEAKKVCAAAEPRFLDLRKSIGPPWDKDHKLAMAAAIVAARTHNGTRTKQLEAL